MIGSLNALIQKGAICNQEDQVLKYWKKSFAAVIKIFVLWHETINYSVRADLLVSPSLFVLCAKLILFSLVEGGKHLHSLFITVFQLLDSTAPRQQIERNCTMGAKFIIFVDNVCKMIHFRQDRFIVFFDWHLRHLKKIRNHWYGHFG